MEQPSHPKDAMNAGVGTLEGQLREMYGRVAYTHKTHEKMADAYVSRYRRIKTTEIVLSALASSSFLIAVFGDSKTGTIIGAVLSTILLGFVLYFKEASLGEQAQKHTVTASKLWGIREQLLSLIVDMRDGRDAEEVRSERNHINEELEEIYKAAPRTSGAAYEAAQNALKNAEELYFADEELDHLLPKNLRISGSGKT